MSDKMKLIMENWRKLNEDNYEDSGEPWDPKSSSYPFQHKQKGLLLRTRNRPNFNAWWDEWKKANPNKQLTKAVRVAPKGEPGKAITRMAALMREEADESAFPGPYIPRSDLRGMPSPAIENEASILSQLYQVNGGQPVYFQSDPYEGRDNPDYGKYNLYIGEKTGLGYGISSKRAQELAEQGVTHIYFKKGDMYEPTLGSIGIDQIAGLNRHRRQMRRDAETYGNYHYLPEDLDEMIDEELAEGWLQKALAGGALALGMMGSPTAQADDVTPAPDATTQTAPSAEYNPYHVLLGMLDMYIDSKDVAEKGDANLKWANVLAALDKASDGDADAVKSLAGKDAKLLKVLEQHVEKNAGDQEILDMWGERGAGLDIGTYGSLEEEG